MKLEAKLLLSFLVFVSHHSSTLSQECISCPDHEVDDNNIRWFGECNNPNFWEECINDNGNSCLDGRYGCPHEQAQVGCHDACFKEHDSATGVCIDGKCFCKPHKTCREYCTEKICGAVDGTCEPGEEYEGAVDEFVCVCWNEEREGVCYGDPGYITSGGAHFVSHVLFKHVLLQTRKGPKLNTDQAVVPPGSSCDGKTSKRKKRQTSVATKIPDFTVYKINQCGQWLNGECQFANPWVAEFHIYGQGFNISFNGLHLEDDFFISISVNGGPPLYQWEYKGKNGEYILFEPRDSSFMKADLKTNFGLRFFWSISKIAGDNRWMHVYVPRTPSFTGTLEGVLGVFDNDNDTTNDLRLPDDTVFTGTDYDQFVQSWHADSIQRSKKVKKHNKKACKNKAAKRAEEVCTGLLHPDSSPFGECFKPPYRPKEVDDLAQRYGEGYVRYQMTHWYYQSYLYETGVRARAEANRLQCINDVCLLEKEADPLANGACSKIEDFVNYCKNMKTGLDMVLPEWKTKDFCLDTNPCPDPTMEWTDCLECPKYCKNGFKTEKCRKPKDCQGGCRCKKAYLLDVDQGKCVPKSTCKDRPKKTKNNEKPTPKPKPKPKPPTCRARNTEWKCPRCWWLCKRGRMEKKCVRKCRKSSCKCKKNFVFDVKRKRCVHKRQCRRPGRG